MPPPGPARVLAAATFAGSVGTGALLTSSVLYFTSVVGLPAGQVGAALSVAAVAGLLAGVPLGHAGDRWGARRLLLGLVPAQAVVVLGYLLVTSAPMLVVVLSLAAALETGSSAVRAGLVAALFREERRVTERARMRAVTNLGVGVGSVLAGAALVAGTRTAFVALLVAAALALLAAAAVLRGLPRTAPAARPSVRAGFAVATDRRYLAVLALQAVLFLDYGMLEVAFPLWTAYHTSAPVALVAVVFVLNTAVIAVGQVRASRGTGDVPGAGRRARWAGLMLAAACLFLAAAGNRPPALAAALLLAAAAAHVLGEMWQAAASWGIAYALAPADAHGQYQGALAGAVSLASMLAPVLLAGVVIQHGFPGWLGLALAFAAAGWATGPVARWAARGRPRELRPA